MPSILITSFHEALNAVSQPITKPKNHADSMSNVILSTRNAVAKKPGTEPINLSAYASGSEILSIHDFLLHEGDTVRKVVFNAGTDLYEVHLNSGVAGVIKSGLAARSFQYDTTGRTLYMGNGREMLKYYALAGYSLFADEEQILDESNTKLAQSFISLHGNSRTCASVSLPLKRTGAIPSSTKVTIEIQPDSSGDPSGTPIANGTSKQINGDAFTMNWEWVSFTFATMPTLATATTYWIVLKTSALLTSGLDLGWGVDASSPSYSDGQFSAFNGSVWSADVSKDALFQVFVQPDKWGITAPTGPPDTTLTNAFNPSYTTGQDTHLELDDQVDGNLAQSFIFSGSEDRVVFSVDLRLKKVGSPIGDMLLILMSDNSGTPDLPNLGISEGVSVSSVTSSYSWITFTFSSPVALSADTKYWVKLSGTSVYDDVYSAAITAIQWGLDETSPTYTDGELAKLALGVWTIFPNIDALFRIQSSIFSEGGRKYAISYKNSVTGHVSNRSTATGVSLSAESVLLNNFPASSDGQVDKVVIWGTTDGGEIFFKLTEVDHNPSTYDDNPIDDDDLDITIIAPENNDPPPNGDLISRHRDSTIVAGVAQNPQTAFYSAGLGQTLIGVPEESFPALNFMNVPSGSERIYALGSIDEAPLAFTNDRIFTVVGEPDSFRMIGLRGGKGIGSVSKLGGVGTEIGYFFFSSDRRVYLLPTISHIPDIASAISEDVFEAIASDSPFLLINSMEKVRMDYWNFGDQHWLIITLATGNSTLNNEMWIYDLDLHKEHPGKAWMGPITLQGGEGFQFLRIITDATHTKRLIIGDDGGFLREMNVGNQDGGANFSSSYTFPWMDDGKPDIVKDGLTAEVIVPSGQTIPANFLQVSYDSQSNFETIDLVAVNEMERGASGHRYRGYLMKQFTRIQPKINFASEDAVGELWSLRIDYEPLFSTAGTIHDA